MRIEATYIYPHFLFFFKRCRDQNEVDFQYLFMLMSCLIILVRHMTKLKFELKPKKKKVRKWFAIFTISCQPYMELQQTGTQIGIQDNDSGLDSSVAHDGMEFSFVRKMEILIIKNKI